jgi:3-oxoadipate enol-lactonase
MSSIVANGLRQFYRREGNPALPTLVLAHPIGFDHGLWDPVVPGLLDEFHLIRYDLRGHGGSEAATEPYSVDLLAKDALALLDALKVDDFSFVGTSLGGLVGLQLAVTVPARVRALVVANASARLPLPPEEWNRRIALAQSAGTEPFIDGMTQRMFTPGFVGSASPRFHTLIESFRAMNPAAYAAAMAALRDADLAPSLPSVRARTLIVAGETDSAVPREHSQRMADSIAGARLVVLPGGHLSAVESPVAFAAEVATFVR